MTLALPTQGQVGPVPSFDQVSTVDYVNQMQSATAQTNLLSSAVDGLNQRLDGITKRAGRRIQLFAAKDFAGLSGAAADSAEFEHQLSTLNATAAVTPLNMGKLKSSIESTFTTIPVSRGDVVALATSLTSLGVTGARDIGALVNTFTKLGQATGEGPQELAAGLVQLSRLFGQTDPNKIGDLANSLLTVSKDAGVSATGVLSFANAIAPLARQAGISEAAVLGISTAFSKAGADGFVAANTFNTIVSSITSLTQSGSPDIAKFSNLIGVTVDQFKRMDKTTAVERIFSTLSSEGPKAINTLNRLGIDGVRAQSAIAAVVQSGNLDQSVSQAVNASHDQKNLNRASSAASGGVINDLTLLRNELTNFGDMFGEHLLMPIGAFLKILAQMGQVVTSLVRPFTPLIDVLGVLVGSFAAVGGGALVMMGLLSKIALAGFIGRSSPVAAFLGGRRNAMTGEGNVWSARAATSARNAAAASYGPEGASYAVEGRGLGWWQSPFYNAGNRFGGKMAASEAVRQAENELRAEQGLTPVSRIGFASRTAAYVPRALNFFGKGQVDYVRDAGRAPEDREGGMLAMMGRGATRVRGMFAGSEDTDGVATMTATERAAKLVAVAEQNLNSVRERVAAAAQRLRAAETEAAEAAVQSAEAQQKAAVGVREASTELTSTLAQLSVAMVRTGASTTVAGGGMLARGIGRFAGSGQGLAMTGGLVGGIGGQYLGHAIGGETGGVISGAGTGAMLGSMFGPWGLAAGALGGGLLGMLNYSKPPDHSADISSDLNPIQQYDQALNQTSSNLAQFGSAVSDATTKLNEMPGNQTLSQTGQVTSQDRARYAGGTPTDKVIAALSSSHPHDTQAAVSYLQTLGIEHGGMSNTYLQAIKGQLIRGYGATGAQKILDQYLATDPSSTAATATPDYSRLGRDLRGQINSTYKTVAGAAVSGIVARSQVDPSAASLRAEIGQLGALGSSVVARGMEHSGGNDIMNIANGRSFNALVANALGVKDLRIDGSNGGLTNLLYALSNSKQGSKVLGAAGFDASRYNKLAGAVLNNDLSVSGGGPRTLSAKQEASDNAILARMASAFEKEIAGSRSGTSQQTDTAKRIAGSSSLGAFAERSSLIQNAINQPDNPGLQYQGMIALYNAAGGGQKPVDQVIASFSKLEGAINDTTDPLYQLSRNAREFANQMLSYQLPNMSRAQQLGTTYSLYREADVANQQHPTNDTKADLQAAQGAYQQQQQSYISYMNSTYQAAKQFGIQRVREVQDENIQVAHANRDFRIQELQAQQDYYTALDRAERDHRVQLANQAQSEAQTIYNPFQRVQAAYTSSGATVSFNLADQNQRLQTQKKELDALHRMGLSDAAIQTLDLADPNNAQQLDRLMMDAQSDPNLIPQLNAQTATRLKLTKSLTQNNYNLGYQQQQQQFQTQLSDQSADYDRARDRAQKAEELALEDMSTAFSRMVDRSQQDLADSFQELYGSFGTTYARTLAEINTQIGKYAPQIASTLDKQISSGVTSLQQAVAKDDAGVLGINSQGQIGSYDVKGNFTRIGMGTNQLAANGIDVTKLPHIVNPVTGHAMGGISTFAHVANISEGNKPETIIPLDARGAKFMAIFAGQVSQEMMRTMQGRTGPITPMAVSGSSTNVRVDQSTEFSGPITVQAQDPNEMQRKLDEKKRVKRLMSPARR